MHVYIAPVSGNPVQRCCTIIIIPTQTCFNPTHTSAPRGAWCGTNHAHDCLILSGTHSLMADSSSRHIRRHCSRGASNLRPFGYGSTLKLTALSRLYILFIFFVNSIYFLRKFVNRPPMAPPTSHQIYKIISL